MNRGTVGKGHNSTNPIRFSIFWFQNCLHVPNQPNTQ